MDTLDVYDDYVLAKELQGLSPTTLARYEYSVRRLLTDLDKKDITDITAAAIRRWLSAKTYSDVSRRIDIKNLKTFFRWVRDEGYRDDNPMKRIPMPKTPDPEKRALDEGEMSKLIR